MMFWVNVDLNVTFPQQIEHLDEKTFRWLPLHSFKILIRMFFSLITLSRVFPTLQMKSHNVHNCRALKVHFQIQSGFRKLALS